MRRGVALILLTMVLAVGCWAQEPTRSRKRIAVLSFDPPMEYRAAQIGNIIGDMLTTALVKMGLEVIERSQLEAVLREQQLARSGIIDPATAVEMGKILGVDYILGGRITEFGIRDESQLGGVIAQFSVGVRVRQSTARVKADVRLIDVRTGRILMAETGEGRETRNDLTLVGAKLFDWLAGVDFGSGEWAESQIGRATRKAVDDIARRIAVYFPSEAEVIAVMSADEFIVDRGRFQGVRVGDNYEVFRVSVVRNSRGQVVWTDTVSLGMAKVVDVQDERAKLRFTRRAKEATEVKEGDIVRAVGSARR
jgi:curli biogenesis system outer membrane secretion channel CsgG